MLWKSGRALLQDDLAALGDVDAGFVGRGDGKAAEGVGAGRRGGRGGGGEGVDGGGVALREGVGVEETSDLGTAAAG